MALLYKEKEFFIHTSYVDTKENARLSGILDICQDIAGMHAIDIGVGYDVMVPKGYGWIVLYERLVVRSRMPKFGEDVLVKTWPKARGRLEFEREYEVCDKDGNSLVSAISNWAVMDINARRISKAADVNYEGEYYQNSFFTEKTKRRIGLTLGEVIASTEYKIQLSDLDPNGHMNNAKYLDIIYNMNVHKEYMNIKEMEIAFIQEARLDDTINVKYFKNENSDDCYIGMVNDMPCFEVIIRLED
ncbi:MAG: hypothetical protein IJY14_03655 [Acholeplasmatales bacterium]|nr:hypothetical protein [Acholeplasmatales bacterium]